MSPVQTANEGTMTADENYLHDVITHPNIHPLPGFSPIMPPTADILTEADIKDIIAYMKSISKNYHPSAVLPAASGPSSQPSK